MISRQQTISSMLYLPLICEQPIRKAEELELSNWNVDSGVFVAKTRAHSHTGHLLPYKPTVAKWSVKDGKTA